MPQRESAGEVSSGERVVDAIQPDPPISDAEKEHVKDLKNWALKIERNKWPDNKTINDICKENRIYVKGSQGSDGGTGLVRANLIQSNIRKSVNRTYARNPEISIIPTEAVTSTEYQKFRALGKTSEIVVNHFLKKANIKARAKQALRAAKTCRIGWVKVGLQKRLSTDAHIKKRINDLQDNIQTLERLKLEATDPEFRQEEQGKVRATMLERQQLIDSLQKEVEVVRAEGITLDLIKTEHILVDTTQVEDLDDYIQASRIGQKYFLDRKTALERFGEKAKSLSVFGAIAKERAGEAQFQENAVHQVQTDENHPDRATEQTSQSVHCYEIWDRKTLKVYTVGNGYDGYLRPPITPQEEVGEQWYPYFPLATGRIDGQFWPISDVELLKELQDEISSSLTRFKDHREKSLPFTLFEKSAMEPTETSLVTNPKGFEFIGIKGLPDKPLSDILHEVRNPPIDPVVYDTTHLERKMEQVTSAGEATQPKSNKSKTLGEAKILTQDIATDASSDQDEIEEWYKALSTYVWQVLLKTLDPQQVQAIAGEDAQWPDVNISLPAIYNQLRLEVKAGSSGKPNKIKETETLTTIMPIVKDMIEQIAKLQAEGQEEIANTAKIVLQEFLRRADERFDVEEFFPEAADEADKKAKREAATAKQQQDQAELIDLEKAEKKANIAKSVSEAEKNQALGEAATNPPSNDSPADHTFDREKLESEERLRKRDIELKAATDVQINQDKLASAAKLKQEEFASQERIAEIEAETALKKENIRANTKDREIAANKQMKADELETQEKTAKMSAESSEKVSSDKNKSSEKVSKNKTNSAEPGETMETRPTKSPESKDMAGITESLEAITNGLTAVISHLGEDKKIIRENGKPVGMKNVKGKGGDKNLDQVIKRLKGEKKFTMDKQGKISGVEFLN